MHWGLLFSISSVKYIKILGYYIQHECNKTERWRVKGRQASRPEELQGSRGLLAASLHPDLELKVTSDSENLTGTPKKKNLSRNPVELEDLGRGSLAR